MPHTVMRSRKCCVEMADTISVKEIGMEPKPNPDLFMKSSCSISGYGDEVEIPKLVQDNQVDYEGEFTIVIGKDAKDVSELDAMNYVLGYTVADDVSARLVNFAYLLQFQKEGVTANAMKKILGSGWLTPS